MKGPNGVTHDFQEEAGILADHLQTVHESTLDEDSDKEMET